MNWKVLVSLALIGAGCGGSVAGKNVDVTSEPPKQNGAPVVALPETLEFPESAPVKLTASAADPDGDALTFTWTQTAGLPLTFEQPNAPVLSFDAPAVLKDETLTFELNVCDDKALCTLAKTTVVVRNSVNEPPSVTAAASPASADEGATVALIATASDPNSDALTFLWTQTAGPTATLTEEKTAKAAFKVPGLLKDDLLSFSVKVCDQKDCATAKVDVAVKNALDEPPVISPSATPSPADEGAQVTLSANATDPNGDALTFSWTQTGGTSVTLSDTASAKPTFSVPTLFKDEVLHFAVKVCDAKDCTPGTVDVAVENSVNEKPQVAAVANPNPADEGTSVVLSATATDANGDALTYSWTQTAGTNVTLTGAATAQAGFTVPAIAKDETLSLSVKVCDAKDCVTQTVNVAVKNTVNEKPVTAPSATPNPADEGATVALAANASDLNGDALTFAWTQTAGTNVTLSGATTAQAGFKVPTLLKDETLTFSVKVCDAKDCTTGTVDVAVKNTVNEKPSATPAPTPSSAGEGTKVTLDANATDPNGDALTFAWTQTAGTNVTLSGAATAQAGFTVPTVAKDETLSFSVKVCDAKDCATFTVDVAAKNTVNEKPVLAPKATPTPANEGSTVVLSANATDANGDALTYLWTQTTGTTAALSDTTAAQPSFTVPALLKDETLTFSVKVCDGTDCVTSAVLVDVKNTVNEKPTASASANPTSAGEGVKVALEANATDPNGDPLLYVWTQTAGTTATLSDSAAPSPAFDVPTVLRDELLTFSVKVCDAKDCFTSAVSVGAKNTVNEKPVASPAASPTAADEGASVSLSSNASDPNGDALTFAWVQKAGAAVALSSASAASPTFTAPTVTKDQTLTFEVTVCDAKDCTVGTASLTVRDSVNESPLVSPAATPNPADEQSAISLAANGSDPNGEALTFTWTQKSGPAVTLTGANQATATFTAPSVAKDTTLSFDLKACDTRSGCTTGSVTVTVKNTVNDPPTLGAISGATTVNDNTSGSYSATGSDPNGDALTFAWSSSLTGVTFTPSNAASALVSFPDVAADTTATLTLKACDPSNSCASSTLDVTVKNANRAPVPVISAPSTADLKISVTLDGSGSSDPDGGALTYGWKQLAGPAMTLSSTTTAKPTFTTPVVEADVTLTFELTVCDPQNSCSPATADIKLLGASTYVSALGNDADRCTQAKPCKSINKGIANSVAYAINPVRVDKGDYAEVTMANGVTVSCGYDSAGGWARDATVNVSRVVATSTTAGITFPVGTVATLDGCQVVHAATPAPASSSFYGVYVRSSGSATVASTLTNLKVDASWPGAGSLTGLYLENGGTYQPNPSPAAVTISGGSFVGGSGASSVLAVSSYQQPFKLSNATVNGGATTADNTSTVGISIAGGSGTSYGTSTIDNSVVDAGTAQGQNTTHAGISFSGLSTLVMTNTNVSGGTGTAAVSTSAMRFPSSASGGSATVTVTGGTFNGGNGTNHIGIDASTGSLTLTGATVTGGIARVGTGTGIGVRIVSGTIKSSAIDGGENSQTLNGIQAALASNSNLTIDSNSSIVGTRATTGTAPQFAFGISASVVQTQSTTFQRLNVTNNTDIQGGRASTISTGIRVQSGGQVTQGPALIQGNKSITGARVAGASQSLGVDLFNIGNSQPVTVDGNVIDAGLATTSSTGLSLSSSSNVSVSNNTLRGGTAATTIGLGIAATGTFFTDSLLTVTGNAIEGGTATTGSSTGLNLTAAAGTSKVSGNTIRGGTPGKSVNTSYGINVTAAVTAFNNNVVYGGQGQDCIGLRLAGAFNGDVTNNRVNGGACTRPFGLAFNTTTSGKPRVANNYFNGGGVSGTGTAKAVWYCAPSADAVRFWDNIVDGGATASSRYGFVEGCNTFGTTSIVANNDFRPDPGGVLYEAVDTSGNPFDLNTAAAINGRMAGGQFRNNVSVDPLFVNEASADYHLAAGSPLKDQGSLVDAPAATDMDGQPRSQSTAEIGPDEI